MRKLVWSVAALAGCATSPGGSIDRALSAYAAAADRAERTKTHATDEHPRAVREMHANEDVLRKECQGQAGRDAVRKAIDDRRADADRRLRGAKPEERERLDVEIRALDELKGRLGL